ncbi:MAG: VOC family protein [Oscillospiraceae bacterium]|jgi:predicted enzyme related to lactoylglutathione lyase|nr:VOC family protein [Oscillospiraceae bacterium]
MISNFTIGDLTIDCANAGRACDFYADLMDWEKTVAYGCLALKTDNDLTILFAETDIPYAPPVWPEEPGKQQKQMHLYFTVDDVQAAVDKAIQLGATKAAAQYGGRRLPPRRHRRLFASAALVRPAGEHAIFNTSIRGAMR